MEQNDELLIQTALNALEIAGIKDWTNWYYSSYCNEGSATIRSSESVIYVSIQSGLDRLTMCSISSLAQLKYVFRWAGLQQKQPINRRAKCSRLGFLQKKKLEITCYALLKCFFKNSFADSQLLQLFPGLLAIQSVLRFLCFVAGKSICWFGQRLILRHFRIFRVWSGKRACERSDFVESRISCAGSSLAAAPPWLADSRNDMKGLISWSS